MLLPKPTPSEAAEFISPLHPKPYTLFRRRDARDGDDAGVDVGVADAFVDGDREVFGALGVIENDLVADLLLGVEGPAFGGQLVAIETHDGQVAVGAFVVVIDETQVIGRGDRGSRFAGHVEAGGDRHIGHRGGYCGDQRGAADAVRAAR